MVSYSVDALSDAFADNIINNVSGVGVDVLTDVKVDTFGASITDLGFDMSMPS